jgi:hypothetical protein
MIKYTRNYIKKLNKSFAIFVMIIYFLSPLTIVFASPESTNYTLEDYSFGAAGNNDSDSANYSVQGVLGEVETGRSKGTNYDIGGGFNFILQAPVPPAPTFTNPASHYNKLKVVLDTGGNASDAKFAIAISNDNFTADTRYVQSDNTVGLSLGLEDWQTYASWGGASGNFIIGLAQSTTYYVKVAAKHGEFTESEFGPVSSAATVDSNITFAIGGVASGQTIEGATTDISTSSTVAAFGELPFNQVREGASSLTVTTNAASGYTVTVAQTGNLISTSATVFPYVSGTNASPITWPNSLTTGAYGYHTSDAVLGTGTTSRFSADNTFAQFDGTAREVAYNAGPVTSEVTHMLYSIEVGFAQEAGSYSHTITYIATGVF